MNYSSIVMDHFDHPRNVMDACATADLRGRAGSKAAGLLVEFCLKVSDGRVNHAAFRAWGCPHGIAVASWLTEQLPGKSLDDAQSLDLEKIAGELDLPAEKWRCVLTAEDALRDAARGAVN
jgi:NifU-like protein involved in Fe-S cluster formation